jgi:ribosome maturation factor RimP
LLGIKFVYLQLEIKDMNKRGLLSPLSFARIEMIAAEKIQELVEAKIAEGPNFIVDIAVKPGNNIYILIDNDNGVSIQDCVEMSRHVESGLDREKEDFELHVSSPGLDRPLKVLRQYQKYTGKEVAVTTKEGKKLAGKLLKASESGIELETRSKETVEGKKGKQLLIRNISLTFNQIKETKVVISF